VKRIGVHLVDKFFVLLDMSIAVPHPWDAFVLARWNSAEMRISVLRVSEAVSERNYTSGGINRSGQSFDGFHQNFA
jgi:hypothetical protein